MKTKSILSLFSALAISVSAWAGATIAVTDFTSEIYTHLRNGLPESITENLVNSGVFDVYERDKLGMILEEQGFQVSGAVDTASAVAMGKLIGVDYILTGNIVEFGKEQRDFRGYGVSTSTTFYRLKAGIKVVEIETGRIVFSKRGEAERKVAQSSSMRTRDDTIDTELAKEVADDVVAQLVRSPAFAAEKEESEVKMGEFTVNSTPENADVEIDGVYYGNAGTAISVEEGMHTVTVSLPGYEVWSKKVMVRDGLNFKVTLVEEVDSKVSIEVK